MIVEILCDARRQIRSIVSLCEEFGVRSVRAKFANQNDYLFLWIFICSFVDGS